MNLQELGSQYIQESAFIRGQIKELRPKLKDARGYELIELRRRITILYEMAADCNTIGEHLNNYYSS